MKKILWATLFLATSFAPYAGAQTAGGGQAPPPGTPTTAAATPNGTPPPAQGRRKRVAVFDFDFTAIPTALVQQLGNNVDIGKGVVDLLVKYLVQDGTYSVIERSKMQTILAEQNFSNSDRANPTSAARIGKILGLDAIIVGSITQFGNDTKNTNIGGGGGGFGGFGLGGIKHSNSKAIVNIDARIVDIDTAEILGVAEGHGESSRSSTSLTGGGGNWHGFGAGNADFGSSDFQETILGEAVKASVEQMSAGLIADASKLSARVIIVSGLVAAVDGGQVVLNVGAKSGVKVGDQLSIERITRTIKDPATGQVLRQLTQPVGVVRVTDVDDVSAVCAPVSGSGFKVGDAAKTVTQ
jgi:curli biogenesis system outer membrane secretion channel CsgG